VARLPDKLRAVFDLLWYQGLTQAEAAALLGVAVRTVKSRWLERTAG
jgi:DNA-directed RNA polymerase specialized sigma24 family protein